MIKYPNKMGQLDLTLENNEGINPRI